MNYKGLKLILLLIVGWLLTTQLVGQNEEVLLEQRLRLGSRESNNSSYLNQDYATIPPLRMLIDSAIVHSPLLKTKSIEIAIREWELKTAKFNWADKIETFSEYRYGSVDNVFIAASGNAINSDVSVTSRYHVGARINFTLFDVLDHRRQVQIAQERIDLEKARAQEIEQLIRQEVIRLYVHLSSYKEVIDIKADNAAAQLLNIEDAKRMYKTGEIEIVEYARVKQIADKAVEEFKLAKKEYQEALYLLNDLVGSDDINDWVNPGV